MTPKNDTRWIEFVAYMFFGCSAISIAATYVESNMAASGIEFLISLISFGFGCILLAIKQYGDHL